MERLLMTIADDASQIITHKTVRSAMDRLDTNKDKRITFDEFIRVSREHLDTAACCMVPHCCRAPSRLRHLTCQSVWRTGDLPLSQCCKQSCPMREPQRSHSCHPAGDGAHAEG